MLEDNDPNNGFILMPDREWNGDNVEKLYLQAVVMRRDLHSIRFDLNLNLYYVNKLSVF